MPLAFSYVRFSTPEQMKGDSLRRQTEAAAAWCERNGVTLDTTVSMRDLGVSAFKGKHRSDKHCLGAFIKLAESGRIPEDSYLIIERLDRLTREEVEDALELFLRLKKLVRIVQLSPVEVIHDRKSPPMQLMMALVELMRGHDESKAKSDRVGQAWGTKKTDARENGTVQTTRLPAWLRVVDREWVGKRAKGGRFQVIPDRAATVKRIFELACNGYGVGLIVKELTNGKVETWGKGALWSKAYVRKILAGRAVLGEYQPKKGAKAEGQPIPGYYPAVIDETTWQRAQAGLASRKGKPGRVGVKVASLFTGLLVDVRTGENMLISWQFTGPLSAKRNRARSRRQVLIPAGSMEGRGPATSFPYDVFEAAILSRLREIKPADVIGEEAQAESTVLAGELSVVEQRLRDLEAELGGSGDIPTVVKVVKALEDKRTLLAQRLATAKQKEATPQGAAWAETKTLLDVATDEPSRLRLRGLLRTIISDIQVLVVPRKSHRLAAVQMNFVGGSRRDYLVHYWSAGNGRQGGWQARSWLADDDPMREEDLREGNEAQFTELYLKSVPLDLLFPADRVPGKPTA